MSRTPPRQRIEDFTPLPGVPRPSRRARKLYRAYLDKHRDSPVFRLLRAECAEIPNPGGRVLGGIEMRYRLLDQIITTVIPNQGQPWDMLEP